MIRALFGHTNISKNAKANRNHKISRQISRSRFQKRHKNHKHTQYQHRICTSIGANIREAFYGHGKNDFIAKLQIALKECYETDYWLGLFKDTHMITEEEYKDMFAKCSKIRKLLIASITTAKENA